jgi:hypothetical protein
MLGRVTATLPLPPPPMPSRIEAVMPSGATCQLLRVPSNGRAPNGLVRFSDSNRLSAQLTGESLTIASADRKNPPALAHFFAHQDHTRPTTAIWFTTLQLGATRASMQGKNLVVTLEAASPVHILLKSGMGFKPYGRVLGRENEMPLGACILEPDVGTTITVDIDPAAARTLAELAGQGNDRLRETAGQRLAAAGSWALLRSVLDLYAGDRDENVRQHLAALCGRMLTLAKLHVADRKIFELLQKTDAKIAAIEKALNDPDFARQQAFYRSQMFLNRQKLRHYTELKEQLVKAEEKLAKMQLEYRERRMTTAHSSAYSSYSSELETAMRNVAQCQAQLRREENNPSVKQAIRNIEELTSRYEDTILETPAELRKQLPELRTTRDKLLQNEPRVAGLTLALERLVHTPTEFLAKAIGTENAVLCKSIAREAAYLSALSRTEELQKLLRLSPPDEGIALTTLVLRAAAAPTVNLTVIDFPRPVTISPAKQQTPAEPVQTSL